MIISAHIIVNSKKQSIEKGDIFKIKLVSKAENNKANKELLSILSNYFNVPVSHIRIIKGLKSRNKLISITPRNKG